MPDAIVQHCTTLSKAAMCDSDAMCDADPMCDSDAMCDADAIPVPNVSSHTMTLVVSYYARLAELETTGDVAPNAMTTFRAGFFQSLEQRELFDVLEAANYLEATRLLDDACVFVASMIRGKTSAQIREIFRLAHDMTDAEQRDLSSQFSWALK
jgi:S-phase kinase-associated protein 1